jgi:hypothetical protein
MDKIQLLYEAHSFIVRGGKWDSYVEFYFQKESGNVLRIDKNRRPQSAILTINAMKMSKHIQVVDLC